MAEKKETKKAAATTKAAVKKTVAKASSTASKTATKKAPLIINAENVGFKAGDVYQTLATAQKPMDVKAIAKSAGISEEETLLGMGWLFKEGKVKDEDGKVTLA
ncbi:MAG: winged helix-turn-helix domain-containing protein [Prevotella sp.]|nr:winged helix-turn-helix domain-containing protein [Prevotella sp.]